VIAPEAMYRAFRAEGVTFFTGVPDSLLKHFCAYVSDQAEAGEHIIAPNEGSAVALAIGEHLATGAPALVYMQNSGFGNALNPLLSLADPEVYGIPMVLLVGWRGEPGCPDEPQHLKQGRIMEPLLRALEMPYTIIDKGTEDPDAAVAEACRTAVSRESPYVLLVRAGAFAPYEARREGATDFPLTREDALEATIGALRGTPVVVSTTGKASRELFERREAQGEGHERDFLTVGGMGHASQVALGIALRCPELDVVCLDGDGAVLMHMGALAAIASESPPNLTHVVLNNGAHDSVGGQPTVAFQVDLPAIARACGYRVAQRARGADEIVAGLEALRGARGPRFLEIQVNKGARADLGRPTTTPKENRDALMGFVRNRASRGEPE
jgi:phosphonopyruvate decarboxylase